MTPSRVRIHPMGILMIIGSVVMAMLVQPAMASKGVLVTLAPEKEVTGSVVMLGDVADIQGDDPVQVRRLQKMTIGRSPLPGKSRFFDRDYLAVRMRQNGMDNPLVTIKGADAVEVLRGYVQITETQIKTIVYDYVNDRLLTEGRNGTVTDVRVSHSVIVPKGRVTYQVKPLKHTVMKGKVPIPVHLLVNGRLAKKIMAVAEVAIMESVVVAGRPLKKAQIVTESDLVIREMDLSDCPSNSFTRLEDVVGKRLRRSVDAFSILRSDLVDLPPLVRRGDVVQIVAESENLKIRTMGIVKGIGARLGERVQVVNADSNRQVYAKVVDAKTVTVEF